MSESLVDTQREVTVTKNYIGIAPSSTEPQYAYEIVVPCGEEGGEYEAVISPHAGSQNKNKAILDLLENEESRAELLKGMEGEELVAFLTETVDPYCIQRRDVNGIPCDGPNGEPSYTAHCPTNLGIRDLRGPQEVATAKHAARVKPKL